MKRKPHFILSNDDGIEAKGLASLKSVLVKHGRVTVIAPNQERSGVSHAFTMNQPLVLKKLAEDEYSLSGTPADCVMFALRGLATEGGWMPDLVVSGINHGANLGADVVYSGTVAAAREAAMFGIPSVAVSLATEFSSRLGSQHLHLETAAVWFEKILVWILEKQIPKGSLLNINVPNMPADQILGIQYTRLGKRIYRDRFVKSHEEGNESTFWLGGEPPTHEPIEGTDFDAMDRSMVSVTPVRWAYTEPSDLLHFKDWPVFQQES